LFIITIFTTMIIISKRIRMSIIIIGAFEALYSLRMCKFVFLLVIIWRFIPFIIINGIAIN